MVSLEALGTVVRRLRSQKGESPKQFGQGFSPPIREKVISDLESGKNIPTADELRAICRALKIPADMWQDLVGHESHERTALETALEHLTGRDINVRQLEGTSVDALNELVDKIVGVNHTPQACIDIFNRLLVFYGIPQISQSFFDRYITVEAFASVDAFSKAVLRFQVDAVRMFSGIRQAFEKLATAKDLRRELEALQPRSIERYTSRAAWDSIAEISEDRLSDLGYISAARVKKERDERTALSTFMKELAEGIQSRGRTELSEYSDSKLRRMDSLLRKFNANLPHGFLSPLFAPDPDGLMREADRIAPKDETDLARMQLTQQIAERNLAHYLSADHMDVYVATSMRSEADFVSVSRFVKRLFSTPEVAVLRLRYFNPTQSWIEDRVAKGLVEALMLRRADIAVYMAQKEDTFGKDSEASVTLGQGKPVIVYVPRLFAPAVDIDSGAIGLMSRPDLMKAVGREGTKEDGEIDETFDDEALQSRLLTLRLSRATPEELGQIARDHWADFDLYGEAMRVDDEPLRKLYRAWLDSVVVRETEVAIPPKLRDHFVRVVVAVATRFERRAKIFREIHPLALQVILSTGVLNGILVSRSVDSCARLLRGLIENKLALELIADEINYKLVEVETRSTVRVISRHVLLSNAFETFYSRQP